MDPNNTTHPLPAENNTVNDATLALDAAIREAQAFNQDVNEVISRITSAIHKAQLEAVEAIQNEKQLALDALRAIRGGTPVPQESSFQPGQGTNRGGSTFIQE